MAVTIEADGLDGETIIAGTGDASRVRTADRGRRMSGRGRRGYVRCDEQAPSCAKAAEIYGLCTWGSSMDIQFADAAIKKCEADFLDKLTPQQRRTYDRAKTRCGRKYARESGTLYRSFEASCSVELAKTYWTRMTKAGPGKPKQ
jgi:hypothetical protein